MIIDTEKVREMAHRAHQLSTEALRGLDLLESFCREVGLSVKPKSSRPKVVAPARDVSGAAMRRADKVTRGLKETSQNVRGGKLTKKNERHLEILRKLKSPFRNGEVAAALEMSTAGATFRLKQLISKGLARKLDDGAFELIGGKAAESPTSQTARTGQTATHQAKRGSGRPPGAKNRKGIEPKEPPPGRLHIPGIDAPQTLEGQLQKAEEDLEKAKRDGKATLIAILTDKVATLRTKLSDRQG